jgi:hypothetical protein
MVVSAARLFFRSTSALSRGKRDAMINALFQNKVSHFMQREQHQGGLCEGRKAQEDAFILFSGAGSNVPLQGRKMPLFCLLSCRQPPH